MIIDMAVRSKHTDLNIIFNNAYILVITCVCIQLYKGSVRFLCVCVCVCMCVCVVSVCVGGVVSVCVGGIFKNIQDS